MFKNYHIIGNFKSEDDENITIIIEITRIKNRKLFFKYTEPKNEYVTGNGILNLNSTQKKLEGLFIAIGIISNDIISGTICVSKC